MSERIAFIGFGEAGQTISRGLVKEADKPAIRAYDILFGEKAGAPLEKAARDLGVALARDHVDAVREADLVMLTVTAASSLEATRSCLPGLRKGQLFLDMNSVSPKRKIETAALVAPTGAAYVDCAVMAPAAPYLHKVPCLIGGPGAAALAPRAAALGLLQGNKASIVFELLDPEVRSIPSGDFERRWREAAGQPPGVRKLTFASNVIQLGSPVQIELSARSPEGLAQAVQAVQENLRKIEGVSDVRDDRDPGKQEVQFELKPSARALGLTLESLALQVRAAFFGAEALRVQRGRDEVLPVLQAQIPGLTYAMGGEQREQARTLPSLARNFVLAVFCMYALLALAFRSYVQPLIVLASIPLGLVGAVLGHLALGLSMGLTSLFGLVGLAGIIVNGSLVLIDFFNEERARQAGGRGAARRLQEPFPADPAHRHHDLPRHLPADHREEHPGAVPHPAGGVHRRRRAGRHLHPDAAHARARHGGREAARALCARAGGRGIMPA